ncbi:MAG: CPBP family intramembrane metalloprotease [Rikenellaceae bacterium]|nr:CPBP family intramembrane metalloprotease [Rikenellaceae bacterium]
MSDIAALLVLFFAGNIISGVIAGFMPTLLADLPVAQRNMYLYGGSMLIALLLMWGYARIRGSKVAIFRYHFHWLNTSAVLWGVVAITAIGVIEEPLLSLMPEEWLESVMQQIGTGAYAICTTVILAPIFEELIFRGVLLGNIRRRWGSLRAVLFSSLIFGAIHLIPQQVVNAFLVGIIIGGIYVMTDSILAVITLHAVNNALSYVLSATNPDGDGTLRSIVTDDVTYWSIYAVCVLFLSVSFALIMRRYRRVRKARQSNKTASEGVK